MHPRTCNPDNHPILWKEERSSKHRQLVEAGGGVVDYGLLYGEEAPLNCLRVLCGGSSSIVSFRRPSFCFSLSRSLWVIPARNVVKKVLPFHSSINPPEEKTKKTLKCDTYL